MTNNSALITSVATSLTNKYVAKLKIRYTKLRELINVINLLFEKLLEQSMLDKKTEKVECKELKKTYIH